MKTILNIFSIATTVAIACLPISPSLAQIGPGDMGGNNVSGAYICTRDAGGRLNIRSGAGQQYKVVTQARNGGVVDIVGSTQGSDNFLWQKIAYGDSQGWVRGDFLCSGTGGTAPSVFYVCTRDANGRLNLRASAANNAKVVAQVRNGRAIQSIDGGRGSDGFYWQQVYYGNTIGWARGDYLCPEGGE
jgi:uncharacterized protein YgiM (DUF1202 family)